VILAREWRTDSLAKLGKKIVAEHAEPKRLPHYGAQDAQARALSPVVRWSTVAVLFSLPLSISHVSGPM
jgi:hypothetical protein